MKLRHTSSRDEQQAFLDYGDRVVDGDTTTIPSTTDLESTFLRVQRAMRADQPVPSQMPDHLKARAWEDIVQNSAVAPTGRFDRNNRPRPLPWSPLPQIGWTGVANVALALLVVIAGFGAWRMFDTGFGGGNGGENDPAPSQPHYAQAPMTPAPIATAMMDETATGCDFGAAVPLYQRVNAAPANGTVLYLTPDGRLMLHCEGEASDTTLAEDVARVSAVGVSNVVELHVDTDEEPVLVYLNVATGEQMEVDMEGFTSYLGHANQSQRFLVAPAPDDPFSWGVYDLETMTPASLNEVTGGSFPTNGHLSVSVPRDGTAMAFAMGAYESEGSARIGGDKSGAGNDIAIVHEDLATATWVTIPDDFPLVTNISMSDDGTHLAIISNPFGGAEQQGASETVIGIIDVETGEEITRSETFIPPWGYPFFTWIEDGGAIAYASEHTIHRLAAENDATPTILYESDVTVYLYQTIPTTNSLLVQEGEPGGEDLGQLLILDTRSGDVTPLEGRAWSTGVLHMVPWETSLAPLVLTTEDQGGTRSWNIVHPETGESLMTEESARDTSPVIEEHDRTLRLRQTRIIADDAPVSAVVLSDDRIVIFDLGATEPATTEVMLPEGIESDGFRLGTIALAPDGSTIIVEAKLDDTSRYWTQDLGDENAGWTLLPEGVEVSYLYTGR